jgi:uncharacterized protein (DUF2235 family)
MAKNIIVCSDGTGNTAVKGRGTNVFKLFEAIDLNGHRTDATLTPQVALYDDGVGTENLKPARIFSGITGWGLSRNVKQLYREIVRIYDPGDSIFMFGFSRGAFTVRTLAGFISTCGLLDWNKLGPLTPAQLEKHVAKAYRVYREAYRTPLMQLFLGRARRRSTEGFRRDLCLDGDVPIRFLGVFDTVDAVGLPFHLSDVLNTTIYRFKFPDHRLSKCVKRACHALAIDDERHSFHPLVWDEHDEQKEGAEKAEERITQVWFAGAHSNVGGGYPKQGMSLAALDWMMAEAELAGLRFNRNDRSYYGDHANVDDKLYDPRAGVGIFYRWKPRDIEAICRENGVRPKIHMSVLERVAHGTEDYAPGNLPAGADLVITRTADPQAEALLTERARNMKAILDLGHGSLLDRVRRSLVVGQSSYYVYLVSCILVLLTAAGNGEWSSLAHPYVLLKGLGTLTAGLLTSPLVTAITVLRQLASNVGLLAALLAGFALAWVLAFRADRHMSREFSRYCYSVQPALREALKRARATQASKGAR